MANLGFAAALLLASFGSNPNETLVINSVDVVEVNHVYDKDGNHVLDQLIFYDWSPVESRFQVRAWRMLKDVQQIPRRDWQRDHYHLTWDDRGILRHVRAKSLRQTWTQFDPEVLAREALPKEQRRELAFPRTP